MQFLNYKETRERGDGRFPVELYEIDASHARYIMAYHWHTEYEIIHVLSGILHCRIGDELIIAGRGDILFVNEGELHSATPQDCVYECLVFDMNRLLKSGSTCAVQLADFSQGGHRFPHRITSKETRGHILHMLALYREKDVPNSPVGQAFLLSGLLFQLFGLLFLKERAVPISLRNQAKRSTSRLKRALELIETAYSGPLSLEELAQAAQMSPKYFCTFFKKMTGYTPIEYLKYYRLDAACLLLNNPGKTITEVALECGFNDLSYFIHEFKTTKGITPKQYQRTRHPREQS